MAFPGLPPVPKGLKECLRAGESTVGKIGDNASDDQSSEPLRGIDTLQNEMGQLRVMDRTLFQQLWSLYESIQDYKQNYQERLSETNSECSSITYSTDNPLETIPDFGEHVYVNEKFHQHIYENQSVYEGQSSNSSGYSTAKEDNVYEPVYLEPKCHKNSPVEVTSDKQNYEKNLSQSSVSSSRRRSSNSKTHTNRLSGIFTQTTYESSC